MGKVRATYLQMVEGGLVRLDADKLQKAVQMEVFPSSKICWRKKSGRASGFMRPSLSIS